MELALASLLTGRGRSVYGSKKASWGSGGWGEQGGGHMGVSSHHSLLTVKQTARPSTPSEDESGDVETQTRISGQTQD